MIAASQRYNVSEKMFMQFASELLLLLAQKEQAVIARLEAGIHSESGHLSAYLQTDFRRGARITKLIIR